MHGLHQGNGSHAEQEQHARHAPRHGRDGRRSPASGDRHRRLADGAAAAADPRRHAPGLQGRAQPPRPGQLAGRVGDSRGQQWLLALPGADKRELAGAAGTGSERDGDALAALGAWRHRCGGHAEARLTVGRRLRRRAGPRRRSRRGVCRGSRAGVTAPRTGHRAGGDGREDGAEGPSHFVTFTVAGGVLTEALKRPVVVVVRAVVDVVFGVVVVVVALVVLVVVVDDLVVVVLRTVVVVVVVVVDDAAWGRGRA